jgi:hypothetical protein
MSFVVIFLPIIQCMWVCVELYEVYFASPILLNIMIHSSPAFSEKICFVSSCFTGSFAI